jgi:hypothetical protein
VQRLALLVRLLVLLERLLALTLLRTLDHHLDDQLRRDLAALPFFFVRRF